MHIESYTRDGTEVLRLINDSLEVDVAPAVGGRIVGILDRASGYRFLWNNEGLPLCRLPAGSEYDPAFFGGIDELLPNDMPETIDGYDAPDHGELWTMALDCARGDNAIQLSGRLPRSGLAYHRTIRLPDSGNEVVFGYRITNESGSPRRFLWKLHAALNIRPGDEIICPAARAVVADPEWSRWKSRVPFAWPRVDEARADVVPEQDGTVDFLYLYELSEGRMGWRRPATGMTFEYRFDPDVFPCCWYFASYGGFFGHTTAVLEPCTNMPISVNTAAASGRCARLDPGGSIETTVTLFAGKA